MVRWERCCDVFETTFRQNREVAMAGCGRLWKLKPAACAPPKRNGVFTEMDRLRDEWGRSVVSRAAVVQ